MNWGETSWFLGNNQMMTGRWWGSGFVFLMVWSLIWTGLALWYAARREEKGWFIVFLLVHTAGILEIIYLVFVANAFATPSRKRKRS
ncbi:hypothetical protein A2875_01035 [Candidatus Gottesmanbacteria bacterium RIFCSPHIGHO2_01_FULL_46_14]|uniref:DUF5652 domain-containing protein n=2 Tax=Candidatus Gottesmaniibacteriota TaxID=1752720 RepID=A0A1F5ZMB0_9BACT|nr:MAG: hypothetical protein A2875_01035 [Candidatus Gottesmanbacteria bacterium RIFCSPHIGHO2_01_FULL_46_14]OGG28952.1 MAG: hypothetical protein A2971_04875 [Candidatus Gottesmanbacteria bacterium RIFCSPLOWO2_01_FULL_46_21]